MDRGDIKHILVAKLRHHGDVLMTSPLFSLLKTYYPNAQIDAYIYKETLPMLDGHPAISHFHLCDRKNKSRLSDLKTLLEIRKVGYDMAINLTEGDRGALAAFASKSRIRVGYDPEGSGFLFKKRLYTKTVRICHGERHAVERHLDVLRVLGHSPSIDDRDLTFHLPKEAKERVHSLLGGVSEFIAIHSVSRWLFKCVPPEVIAQVIRHLDVQGHRIVLTASPDPKECEMVEQILSHVPDIDVINLAGKTTLKELGCVIAMSQLLLTVDSVPLHMASALKAPCVAIFGPTSEKTWAPWRNPLSRVVVQSMPCRPCYMPGCGGSKKSDCLETLSAESILSAISSLLCQLQDQNLKFSPK